MNSNKMLHQSILSPLSFSWRKQQKQFDRLIGNLIVNEGMGKSSKNYDYRKWKNRYRQGMKFRREERIRKKLVDAIAERSSEEEKPI